MRRRWHTILGLALATACAGRSSHDAALAGSSGGTTSSEAGALDAGLCDALQQQAADALKELLSAHDACTVDADCAFVSSSITSCVNSCGLAIEVGDAAVLESTETSLCAPFFAQGCSRPGLFCPYLLARCEGGQCQTDVPQPHGG